MGTFGCWYPKEAPVRDGGPGIDSSREHANEQSNPACTAVGWPQPSAAFLTRGKCGGARAGLQEAGMGEGKTNQLRGKESEVFPAPWVLAASPTCPKPHCPLQRCSGVAGASPQLRWHFAILPALCKRSVVPYQRAPLPKTPCSEPSLPSPSRG